MSGRVGGLLAGENSCSLGFLVMSKTYFRRFRMEIDLERTSIPMPSLPPAYQWLGWDPSLLVRHSQTKFESFRSEIDSRVFPCLGDRAGCYRLMQEISTRKFFLPETTWLIAFDSRAIGETVDCGTIQGVAQSAYLGAIQNVGVIPEHRGLGLGRALVLKALAGFRQAGIPRVYLEVTAENSLAVHLYREIGFKLVRTMYKPVEVEAVPS
jgi:GNAT superfamily N-acetyltransferase